MSRYQSPSESRFGDFLALMRNGLTRVETRLSTAASLNRGIVTLSAGITSKVVTLPSEVTSTDYIPWATPNWNAGAVWITNKSTTSFTLNWVNAVVGVDNTFDWALTRTGV